MTPKIIVSYDGTDNDHDALALGRLFAEAGATVSLAYVRHTHESERRREELEQHEAEALLERGARWLGNPDAQRHVVLSASTGEGLWQLAEREHADLVVFGSEYRTAPGHVQRGTSSQRLLDGGPVAVAIAPARQRDHAPTTIQTIAVVAEDGDDSALETARSLATHFGARIVAPTEPGIDLLIVGSRPEAPQGRVMISSSAEYRIETANCPVLVVPRGVAVRFGAPTAAAA
jgi:nucleotide-binding universal stress UspA family protein